MAGDNNSIGGEIKTAIPFVFRGIAKEDTGS
jgi:hypothetical protein